LVTTGFVQPGRPPSVIEETKHRRRDPIRRAYDSRRLLLSYTVAGGLALAALGLTRLIWPVVEPTSSPLFLAAVVVSAWYGGLGPGLLTTALGTLGKAYFFMLPTRSLRIEDAATALQLGIFVVIAFLISSLTGALRRAHSENVTLIAQERAARAAADAANRSKDVFLATVSHELRTPLHAISTWLQVLRRREGRTDDVDDALQAIERSVATQSRLIDDLLDVSRIVAGELHVETGRVELAPVVAAAVATAHAAAPAKDIDLRVELDPSAGAILGDRERLEQIVCNLVSNALKFTPPRGRVDVRLRRAGDAARITVTDTGCGIPADMLPHIFDEFRQGRRAPGATGQGLGLGLTIVRRLVELHGGRVSVRSDGPGRGSMFVVDLPAADGLAPPSLPGALRASGGIPENPA
jgi:signal transduction histidine kinase